MFIYVTAIFLSKSVKNILIYEWFWLKKNENDSIVKLWGDESANRRKTTEYFRPIKRKRNR